MPAHEFEIDERGYGCKHCCSRYHCAACDDGAGMYGHYVTDDEGGFFHCQDPERNKRRVMKLLKR